MKKAIIHQLPVIVCSGATFIAGATLGMDKGEFQAALEENKLAAHILRDSDEKLSADFREYLKGRIYYNIARKFPNDAGYLSDQWDFGEVLPTPLNEKAYAKDPIIDCSSYEEAVSRRIVPDRAEAYDNIFQVWIEIQKSDMKYVKKRIWL